MISAVDAIWIVTTYKYKKISTVLFLTNRNL